MKKKNLLALVLALTMALSLVACGQPSAPAEPAETPAPATEPAAEPEKETEPAPTETAADDGVWLPYDENLQTKRTDRDATGTKGAVASSSWYASKAGLDVLQAGGNAVDAAIATSYTLGVAEPYTSGLGGGGFMIIYDAETKDVTVIDYREIAPANATPEMWLDSEGNVKTFVDADGNEFTGEYSSLSQVGGMASGTPGEVAGMEYAFEHFGSGNLTRQQLMQPAIDLANNGYVVTVTMRNCTEDEYFEVAHMPEVAGYYLDDNGLPLEIGTKWTNKDLAKTLQMIAEGGADAFYKGEVAQAVADTVQKYGGVMTTEDLANYKVEIRKPVTSTYRDYTIYSLPPASSGGTHLIEALNILENFDMKSYGINSAEYIHLFSEAFKMAFADRAKYMADTAFTEVPLEGLTSKEYAKKLADKITDQSGTYEADDPNLYESSSTTSFSVVDQWGNMVACTQTINDFYGNKVAIPGYGFIMNDEMDDFSSDPTSVNCVAGGKRPLSSMSPSIVLYPDGTPFLTIGTPGGLRIWPTITQIIERMIDYDMDVQDAIDTARIFDNHKMVLYYESDGVTPVTPEVVADLEARGHETGDKGSWNLFFGGVQGIEILKDGTLRGGADPRRDGKALAY